MVSKTKQESRCRLDISPDKFSKQLLFLCITLKLRVQNGRIKGLILETPIISRPSRLKHCNFSPCVRNNLSTITICLILSNSKLKHFTRLQTSLTPTFQLQPMQDWNNSLLLAGLGEIPSRYKWEETCRENYTKEPKKETNTFQNTNITYEL